MSNMTTTMKYTNTTTAAKAAKLSKRYTKAEWTQVLKNSIVVCAFDGDKLVGITHAHGNGPDWWIEQNHVDPAYQRKGLGTELRVRLYERVIEAGATTTRGIIAPPSRRFWNHLPGTRIKRVDIGTRKVR